MGVEIQPQPLNLGSRWNHHNLIQGMILGLQNIDTVKNIIYAMLRWLDCIFIIWRRKSISRRLNSSVGGYLQGWIVPCEGYSNRISCSFTFFLPSQTRCRDSFVLRVIVFSEWFPAVFPFWFCLSTYRILTSKTESVKSFSPSLGSRIVLHTWHSLIFSFISISG